MSKTFRLTSAQAAAIDAAEETFRRLKGEGVGNAWEGLPEGSRQVRRSRSPDDVDVWVTPEGHVVAVGEVNGLWAIDVTIINLGARSAAVAIDYVTPPENQGQAVTRSYGADWENPLIYRRTHDGSDGNVTYEAASVEGMDLEDWDLINGTPRLVDEVVWYPVVDDVD